MCNELLVKEVLKPLQPKVEGLYLMQSVCLFIYLNFEGLLLHCRHTSDTAFQITSNSTFFQQLIQANIKQNIKSSHNLALYLGNPLVTGGFPHKGPVVQKAVLCVSIIMMVTGTLPSTNLTSLLDYSQQGYSIVLEKFYNDRWPWPYVRHWKISDINC